MSQDHNCHRCPRATDECGWPDCKHSKTPHPCATYQKMFDHLKPNIKEKVNELLVFGETTLPDAPQINWRETIADAYDGKRLDKYTADECCCWQEPDQNFDEFHGDQPI